MRSHWSEWQWRQWAQVSKPEPMLTAHLDESSISQAKSELADRSKPFSLKSLESQVANYQQMEEEEDEDVNPSQIPPS